MTVYFIFFLSGVAGLIYEISWSRQIGLLFGHTIHAASVVLASYFAGMAIGYLLGAMGSSRWSPLAGYAVAELIVAGWAIMIPRLLRFSESTTIAPWLCSPSFAWQTTLRVVFCFLLLLPATVALGATLPMIAVYFSSDREGNLKNTTIASRVSLAYALNTGGAFVGVWLATFYLLLFFGVCGSSYFAAALSTFCACAAFLVHRLTRKRKKPFQIFTPALDVDHALLNYKKLGLLVLAGLSGFGTLALQVLYTRMFSLVFHNSTYTFGMVIAVFLASLAIGAALAYRIQHWFAVQRLLGITIALGSLGTVLSVLVFIWLTDLNYFSNGESFAQYMTGAFLLVTIVVAPPITCLGMLLPLVWTMAGQEGSVGHAVGKLTAINTIMAAGGALTASFCLLPWIGMWQSMVLIAYVFFVGAFVLLWRCELKSLALSLGFTLSVASVFVLRSPVEAETNRTDLGERLIKRWNSPYGWIDVVQREGTGAFKIRQNLHYRFGTTGNNAREYRQAHIPLLLHESPHDVLFMGLGTGLTAGGAIPDPEVEDIVVVELIPEVVEAARMLSDYNYRVTDHPRVKIVIDDARHYLLANDRQFDVIVSDLFVPWESESGYLYTVEHYQVAIQRLKRNGLFCQWLPLYQVSAREFESIANSFASVFPNTTIWWGQLESASPVIALIGTSSPLSIDTNQLPRRLNELDRQLNFSDPTIATTDRFWDLYLGDWKLQPQAQLNTDEHPRVEFLTPISYSDGKMLRGMELERYYAEVFAQLPTRTVRQRGGLQNEYSAKQRRARQSWILFGR